MRLLGVVAIAVAALSTDAWLSSATAAPAWVETAVSVATAVGALGLAWAWWSLQTALRSVIREYAGLPADSPLVRTWTSSRQVSRGEDTGRFGAQAASRASRAGRAADLTSALQALTVLAFLASANLYGRWISHVWTVLGLVSGLALATGVVSLSARREKRAAAQLAVEALGGNADLVPAPLRPDDYIKFCADHQVPTYPFGRPEWNFQ